MRPTDSDQPRELLPGAGIVSCPVNRRARAGLAFVLVFAILGFYGAWRHPVPGVNEPHYLTKSRHFWDPSWCARDLFLQSSNVHWVFYATIGALTRVLSFEICAWIGRILIWGGIAAGWVALARRFVSCRWPVVWSAALFLGLALVGNLSGEWLIGGAEAKGFAYAFLLLAVAFASSSQLLPAAAAAGLATSFHPVVGGWGIAALLFAAGWTLIESRWRPGAATPADTDQNSSKRCSNAIAAIVLATLCALPGLIPAVSMVLAKAPPETKRAADRIQVFERLNHHLDPMRFTVHAWWMYGSLLAVWLLLQSWRSSPRELKFFNRFVAGTMLIAAGGLVVGFGPRWPSVLKFYPFRLVDTFLPMGVVFTLVAWWDVWRRQLSGGKVWRCASALVGCVLTMIVLVEACRLPARDQNPTQWSAQKHDDWRAVCQWMNQNTPVDALCLTPRLNYTFRWQAERAEYAIWKDCPQDAESLVEWKRRLGLIEKWRRKHVKKGFTAAALVELRNETGIDYVVGWYVDPYRVPPVFRTKSFSVYQIAGAPPAASTPTLPARE